MLRSIHHFQNAVCSAEDIRDEEGGLAGRSIVIADNDTGDIYKIMMPLDVSKRLGQKLMGIGGLEVVEGAAAAHAANNHSRGDTS